MSLGTPENSAIQKLSIIIHIIIIIIFKNNKYTTFVIGLLVQTKNYSRQTKDTVTYCVEDDDDVELHVLGCRLTY